jgi:hypothetical protein
LGNANFPNSLHALKNATSAAAYQNLQSRRLLVLCKSLQLRGNFAEKTDIDG